MHAARGVIDPSTGLEQILEPAHALLGLDGNTRGVDLLPQGVDPLELVARPELDCREAQRKAFRRDREAGMHEETADGVKARTAIAVGSRAREGGLSDGLRVFSLVRELCGVVQHQDRPRGACNAIPGGEEMALQNLRLADSIVVEESVGRLRVRPVLASEWNAPARAGRELCKKLSKPTLKAIILELTALQFALDPRRDGVLIVLRGMPLGPLMCSRHTHPPCDSRTGEIVMPCRAGACTRFRAHHSPSQRVRHRGDGQVKYDRLDQAGPCQDSIYIVNNTLGPAATGVQFVGNRKVGRTVTLSRMPRTHRKLGISPWTLDAVRWQSQHDDCHRTETESEALPT